MKLIVLSLLLLSPPAQSANRAVVCEAKDWLGDQYLLRLHLDSPKVEFKEHSETSWRAIFGDGIACGRPYARVLCEQNLQHNFDESSAPNKHAFLNVSCTRGSLGVFSRGQVELRLHTSHGGKFWCTIGSTRDLEAELSGCRLE